ncbi:MAG: hypothetical protein ACHQFW_03770 [Chitinophagales bacterium]
MTRCGTYFFVLLSGFITITSCHNEFTINGNYVEKTVVFGLLDYGDDTNFLRIEKSFLDESTSAFVLAGDPSNYFYGEGDLDVYLEQWTDNIFIKKINAVYVNGDTLGIIKEEGIFSSSPNILYRITEPIDSVSFYKLFVINNNTGDTITSEANVVHNYYLYYPTKPNVFVDYSDTTKITYTCKQAINGKMYELWMQFNYYERNEISGDSTLKSIDWQIFSNKIGDNIDGFGNITYSIDRRLFFNFLSTSIDVDENVVRYFSSIDFYWYCGGTEMYDQYLNILANLGINEDYISPEYTNISGGLGLFSSRHKISVNNVFLTDQTLDSIACGVNTSSLRFVSSHTNPDYPGCGF